MENPFEKTKGEVVMPLTGKVVIPVTTEKAKTTSLPTIKVENRKALTDTAIINSSGDKQTYAKVSPANGLELTRIMASQSDSNLEAQVGKNRAEILKQYGGLESNIPLNHPTYWQLL